jgi:hypothetical protein
VAAAPRFPSIAMKHVVVLVAAGLIAGCGYSVSKTQSWSEEVDVGNGQTIVVDRKDVIAASNEEAAKDGKTSALSFQEELSGLPPWNEPMVPLLLYQDSSTGEWTIVAADPACSAPGYREFRLAGDAWRMVELSAASIGKDSNLYLDGYGEFPKSPISKAAKDASRSRPGIPERYRTIVRAGSSGCA